MMAPRHSYNPAAYRSDFSGLERAGQTIAGTIAAIPGAQRADQEYAQGQEERKSGIESAREIYKKTQDVTIRGFMALGDDEETARKRTALAQGPFAGEWFKNPDKAAQQSFENIGATMDKLGAQRDIKDVGALMQKHLGGGGSGMPQSDPTQQSSLDTSGMAPGAGVPSQASTSNPLGTQSMGQFQDSLWDGVGGNQAMPQSAAAQAAPMSEVEDSRPGARYLRSLDEIISSGKAGTPAGKSAIDVLKEGIALEQKYAQIDLENIKSKREAQNQAFETWSKTATSAMEHQKVKIKGTGPGGALLPTDVQSAMAEFTGEAQFPKRSFNVNAGDPQDQVNQMITDLLKAAMRNDLGALNTVLKYKDLGLDLTDPDVAASIAKNKELQGLHLEYVKANAPNEGKRVPAPSPTRPRGRGFK